MAVPTVFTDLSTTPGSNSPAGGEAPLPDLDNFLRVIQAFLASIKANTATNGWVSPYLPLTGGTLSGALSGITDLTTTGNTILGNAQGDTLNVAAGAIAVGAAGNVTIAAPSSGNTLAATALTTGYAVTGATSSNSNTWGIRLAGGSVDLLQITGVSGSISKAQIGPQANAGTGAYWEMGADGSANLYARTTGSLALSAGVNGNVAIAAPSAGASLSITAVSGQNALATSDGTVTTNLQLNGASGALLATTGAHQLQLGTDGSAKVSIAAAGNVTIAAPSSGYGLNIPTGTPASAAAAGTAGDIAWDSSYIYVCTAANTWKRSALSAW